jgi:type I restriction enzyme R subunit
VLETLLDKYADEGIENIEDMKILQVKPLDVFGSPMEIVDLFGGKMGYLKALCELEKEIYAA